MVNKILSLVAICLIAGGCGAMGRSSQGTSQNKGLLPSFVASGPDDASFQRQVENDPFPSADAVQTADMRVRVRQ